MYSLSIGCDNYMNSDIKLVFDALEHTELGKRVEDYKVIVKCPVCGEGTKRHNHSHCYIGLINNGPPVVYHCFMNECSGVVNPNFLHDMGIFDNELDTILNVFNRSVSKLDTLERKIYMVNKKKTNMSIPEILDSAVSESKLTYMRNRLGVKFSYENLAKLKIIFSLSDFLEINKIQPNMKYKRFLRTLNDEYIGFLSVNNDYIVFRNTLPNKNLRYVKYDIFNTMDTTNIIYSVPGMSCDLFANEVNLNICEGTFDALGVFCHVKKYDRLNNIYAACCGSGYLNAIKYFLKLGFIGNLIVNIYSDDDKDIRYYDSVYGQIEPWVKQINIYYNELGKDYGVPGKFIQVTKAVK